MIKFLKEILSVTWHIMLPILLIWFIAWISVKALEEKSLILGFVSLLSFSLFMGLMTVFIRHIDDNEETRHDID